MNRQLSLCVALVLLCASSTLAADPPNPAASTVPPLSPASEKIYAWTKKVMVAGYDSVGKHNPKWDATAREAMSMGAEIWGTPRRHMGADASAYELSVQAVKAGCDDPMLLYLYARTFKNWGRDAAKTIRLHERAADALWDSNYSSYYRSLAQFRVAELQLARIRESRRATGQVNEDDFRAAVLHVNRGTGLFLDLANEADVPAERWIELGDAIGDTFVYMLGLTQAVEKALPLYEKSAPKVAYLTTKGRLYTAWAWEARGYGFASTVTPEGWKLMRERLAVAQAALEEAWKLDPTNSAIATNMLTVELGQGQGRQRMELWFKRAMQANPDNLRACRDKLDYLQPKWHGSPEEMLQFGRECVKEGRFRSDVPLTLDFAHAELSHYTHGGWQKAPDPSYYKNPGVWSDLKSVYDGYLNVDTGRDLEYTRNRYAYLATLCEAWDDANKMFKVIGDHADWQVWTTEKFDAARKEAAEKAGK